GPRLRAGWACAPKPDRARPPAEEQTDPDLVGPDLFENIPAASGVSYAYRNGEEVKPPHLAILESLGGGAGLIDYDGDGLLDVFLVGGGKYGGKDNKRIDGLPCKLYRNLRQGQFRGVAAEGGLGQLGGREAVVLHARGGRRRRGPRRLAGPPRHRLGAGRPVPQRTRGRERPEKRPQVRRCDRQGGSGQGDHLGDQRRVRGPRRRRLSR